MELLTMKKAKWNGCTPLGLVYLIYLPKNGNMQRRFSIIFALCWFLVTNQRTHVKYLRWASTFGLLTRALTVFVFCCLIYSESENKMDKPNRKAIFGIVSYKLLKSTSSLFAFVLTGIGKTQSGKLLQLKYLANTAIPLHKYATPNEVPP